MARMKRLQISIEPDLDTAVERRANQEGISKAEVIRRCVREQVKPLPPIEEDPFFKLCGTVEGDSDSSMTINDVVYGLSRDSP
jgi:hypothetical protein